MATIVVRFRTSMMPQVHVEHSQGDGKISEPDEELVWVMHS